ncbi:MAG: PilZ domain-containing protein [Gammaproteobacteria bacterium]|nr:PilZ domain-containing protein [Gammaproteobacteria bacterium]
MSKNQRQFPREEIQVEVELRFLEEEARTLITRDLSEGGLFMRLKNSDHYPIGEMVNLYYKNPLADYEETEKDGIIVRKTDDGLAVAFIEIDGF